MDILKQIQPGAKLDLRQPVATPIIEKRPDGSYHGAIYIAIGGIALGHIELRAAGLEPLKALVNGLLGYIQSQERTLVIANGPLPAKA